MSTFDIVDSEEENAINFFIVNLKYAEENYTDDDISAILKLMYVLEEKEMIKLSNENELAKEVIEEMERLSSDPKYKDLLFTYEKAVSDELTWKHEYKERGLAEGRAEGRAVGITLGKAEGIAQKTHEIIIKTYQKNKDIDFIADITSVTKEEVIKVLKENNLL